MINTKNDDADIEQTAVDVPGTSLRLPPDGVERYFAIRDAMLARPRVVKGFNVPRLGASPRRCGIKAE